MCLSLFQPHPPTRSLCHFHIERADHATCFALVIFFSGVSNALRRVRSALSLIDVIEQSKVNRRKVSPFRTFYDHKVLVMMQTLVEKSPSLFSSCTDPVSNLVPCLRLPGNLVTFSRLIFPSRYFYPSFVPPLKYRRPVGEHHVELLVYNCMRHTSDVIVVR